MKTYGIYVCYPPTVDMRSEGLGRYLTAFIKGAENINDVNFKIVCPCWSKEGLNDLFESEGVSLNKVSILAPEEEPVILKFYELVRKFKKKRQHHQRGIIGRAIYFIDEKIKGRIKKINKRVASSYKMTSLAPVVFDALLLLVLAVFLSPFVVLYILGLLLKKMVREKGLLVSAKKMKKKVSKLVDNPKDEGFVINLYNSMVHSEAERMLEIIKDTKDIQAWYAPTAFWESFTQINAPRLMCVPDVVLTRFPGGFSKVGGERFYNSFNEIKRAIHQNEYFVTYSDDVKQRTLNEHFNVDSENVYVIKHAPNTLDQWLKVTGFPDTIASTKFYANKLLRVALSKQSDLYEKGLSTEFKFIFYASQIRPNKNIISLLKAYDFLLKNKFLNHKLVLTGKRNSNKDISDFITKHNLERDVVFLSGLSVQELAACYKLADLAVNPTLSEGGCPFTFTEALSVGTPVVMGRIAVTEEVLTDPTLQEMTFFDPYNWKSIADKIEWALDNRDALRDVQLQTYQQLIERSWEDVVTEHIAAMDEIAVKFHTDGNHALGH